MLKQLTIFVALLLPAFAICQVRNTEPRYPSSADEAFFHSDMGIPMNEIWGDVKDIDSVFDATGKIVKRTYTQSGRTNTETWTYYEDGTLKEYFYYSGTTMRCHEIFNPEGYITEFYQWLDGPKGVHWFYTYTTFKIKKQKIFRKEVYDVNNKIEAALEYDITSGKEILLRSYSYNHDNDGRMKTERIRNADGTPGEDWYYYYDEGDRDYKALMDPNMDEIRRVYLEK